MSKIIITLDSSQMKSFSECNMKWAFNYIECLRFHRETNIYIDKGSFVHKLLEIFYILRTLDPSENRFVTHQKVIELYKKGRVFKASGLTKDEESFICERFLQYITTYMNHDFIPTKRNGVPGVELGFSKVLYESGDRIYVVEGKIDLISKTPHGFNCFIDNKTQERLKDLYPFKPQFLTYSWATGFKWGITNYFRLQQKFDPKITFRRVMTYYEDWQIEKWKAAMKRIFDKIFMVMYSHEIEDQNDLKPEMFEQSLESCGGKFEQYPCSYRMICENPGQEVGAKLVYYDKIKKWSPWETETEEVEV